MRYKELENVNKLSEIAEMVTQPYDFIDKGKWTTPLIISIMQRAGTEYYKTEANNSVGKDSSIKIRVCSKVTRRFLWYLRAAGVTEVSSCGKWNII